jgi:hypothetical protein
MTPMRFATVAGIAMVLLCGAIARLGDLTLRMPAFLALFGGLFIVYAASVVVVLRQRTSGPRRMTLIFIVAIACRVVWVGEDPTLSNDIHRYVWEGRVVAEGHNPFSLPPDAPELAYLRNADFSKINHPHMATIYPPLAQLVFAAGAFIAATPVTQKILFTLFDLATLIVIVRLLRRRRLNPGAAIIWAWSPLVMLEFAHSGHMDSLGIFFLVLSVAAFEEGRWGRGMVSMGLSFLAKLLPAALVPFFLLRRRLVLWLPVAVAVAVAGYLPFAGAGTHLWSSLGVYGQHWQFNSLIYRIITSAFSNPDAVRWVLAVCVVVFSFVHGYRQNDIGRYILGVVAFALLVSPTVYPWYVTWLVPFLCLHPRRAWIYFSGAVVLSYWVWTSFHETGEWRLSSGVLALEYVPLYILLVWDAWRTRRAPRGMHS